MQTFTIILMLVGIVAVLTAVVIVLLWQMHRKDEDLKQKNNVIIHEVRRNQTIIDKAVGQGVSRAALLASALVLLFAHSVPAWAWDGSGTAADPYQIRNSSDWATLAVQVDSGHVADGTAFLLMGDISITAPVGTSEHRFNGTFDGGGHTITATLSAGNSFMAPFAYVNNATISHLNVTGTIQGGLHTAGLCGSIVGTSTIEDCHVSADITTSAENSMIVAGGFVGHAGTSTLTVEGCLFDGSIAATSSIDFSYAGAFVGWCTASGMNITVKNCIESGTYTNITHAGLNYADSQSASTVPSTNCYTLSHSWSEVKLAYRIIYLSDTFEPNYYPTDTYTTTDIEASAVGLKMGDIFYVGSGEQVTVDERPKEDYLEFIGYSKSVEITEWSGGNVIFTMPSHDVYMALSRDLDGTGSADDPILIESEEDWLLFTYQFASYYNRNYHFLLTDDIDIYTRAGYVLSDQDLCFTGVFDGGGHTITAHLSGGDYTCPFYKLNGGTIRNLHVAGDISGGLHTSGLVGGILGNGNENLIENCRVSAAITSSSTHAGGFVGHASSSTTTLRGCLFDGRIVGSELTYIGTLVGWCSNSGSGITIEDCADLATYNARVHGANACHVDLVWDGTNSSSPVAQCGSNTNSYGLSTLGKAMVTVRNGNPAMTMEWYLQNGLEEPVEYSVSHLASYGIGLLFDDEVFIAGRNDSDNNYPRFYPKAKEGFSLLFPSIDNGAELYFPINGWYGINLTNTVNSRFTIDGIISSSGDFTGEGTEASPYLIQNTTDWTKLFLDVALGEVDYTGKVFRLTQDIDCGGMCVGTDEHPFNGIFDGDGHTLTLNVGREYNPSDKALSPFYRVSEATFRHLHTAGKVCTSAQYTGGIISQVIGSNSKVTRLYDCHSTMTVFSTISGDASNGGLVGKASGCDSLVIDRCTFTGNLHGQFQATTHCSGFTGWSDVPVTIRQGLFDPADISFDRVVSTGATFVRMADYSNLTLEDCYTTHFLTYMNGLTVAGKQGTFVVDEFFAPEGVSYEFIGEPDVTFNGRAYYKNGCWIRTTLDASIPFNHWQDGTNGCFISDPWTANGLHQIKDLYRKPSLGVYPNDIPEAETLRVMWGVAYRYLSRRDYHFFISDEERVAKGWVFESDDSDANLVIYDSDDIPSEITAVVGYDEDDFNDDGVQIHNDLTGLYRYNTHLGIIAPHAFRNSSKLETLYFKDTDANFFNALLPFDFIIDVAAFENCPNFREMKMMQYTTEGENHWEGLSASQVSRVSDDAFKGCPNLKISVQVDKYQDFLSSNTWKAHRNRFTIYQATTVDFTVEGVKYHYYRNLGQTDELKNDESGKEQMLQQISIWNADYQQFNAASLLDTKDDCNVYYTSIVGVDDDKIDDKDGTMIIYNDPGSYYNYKTINLNSSAIAGNTHVKAIEFWQTYGRSDNSYSDLKMVIPNGAFKNCTNLKELRLFYYAQDGEDRWIALGPKDVIPGDNIFGIETIEVDDVNENYDYESKPKVPDDFRIIVSPDLYPDFMDDPNWKPYLAFIEPMDYSPTTKSDFTTGGLTYGYMTSPGGILQTSQVVSQDVSWWTAPRIAIEVALMVASLGTFSGATAGSQQAGLQAAEGTAFEGLRQSTENLTEAQGFNTFVETTSAKLTSAAYSNSATKIAEAMGSLTARNLAEFGLENSATRAFLQTWGIVNAEGIFIATKESLERLNTKVLVAAARYFAQDFAAVTVGKASANYVAQKAAYQAALKAYEIAQRKWLINLAAVNRFVSMAGARKVLTPMAATVTTAGFIATQCWGGSGSYNADLMNKGMRENILSNIHQVGLVGGGYVITTPQKNLVYHTYIKNVADNVQDAVIYAGFDDDNDVNTSNRTMTFLPKAFQNKTNLKTINFHEISDQSSNTGMPFFFSIPDSAFVGCTALTEFSTLLQTDDNGTRALGPENFVLGGDSIFAGLDSLKFHIVIDPLRKDDFLANDSWKPLERFFVYESATPAAKYSEYGAKYAYAYEQNSIKKEHKERGHLIEHTIVVGPDDEDDYEFIREHQGAVKLCNDIGVYNNYQLDEVKAEAFKGNQLVRSVSFVDLYGAGAFGDCYTGLQVHLGDRAFQGCSNLADLDLLYMVTDGDNHIEPMTPQMISIGEDVFKDSPARLKMMPQQVAWFEADSTWAKYKDRFMPCVVRFTDPGIKAALKKMAYYDPANTGTDPAYWNDYCDFARIGGAGFSCLDGKFTAQKDDIYSFADFKYFESVGLNYVGTSWFEGCSKLANIVLPSTIKSINARAFNGCSALQEIELPQGITSIGANAFDGCTSLNNILVLDSVPATIGANAFHKHNGLKIYVPDTKVNDYKSAWSDYAQYIVGDDTYHINKVVTVTGTGQLASKLGLTLIKEHSKVRYIQGPYARYDSLTVIGPLNGEDVAVLRHMMGADAYDSDFTDGQLRYLNLWDASLTKDTENSYNGYGVDEYLEWENEVGEYVFHNCNALESVVLPKTVTNIGQNTFQEAFGLKRIAVGKNTTKYTRDLLQDLSGIEEVVFLTDSPATSDRSDPWEAPIQQVYTLPSQLGDYLGDPGLTRQAQNITCPFSTDDIMWALADHGHFFPSQYLEMENADNIFCDNTQIKDFDEFYLFQNVKTLGNAFSGMSNMETITLPSSVESIDASAFSGCTSLKTIHVSSVRTEAVENPKNSNDSVQYILPTLAQDAFEDLPENFQILVPKQYCKLYRERWAQYADHINPDNTRRADEEIITVTVTEANTLAEKLGLQVTIDEHTFGSNGGDIYFVNSLKGDYSKLYRLKVVGPISCGDLSVLRHLAGYTPWSDCRNYNGHLEYLDLYDANLVYTPYDCASDKYYSMSTMDHGLMDENVNNQLPPYAFLKAYSLKTLILPRTCTQVKTRAMQECEGLETLVVGDDCTDFNWNALDDDAMLTRLYILTSSKLNISTEDFIWRNLCNNYNPTFDAFYVRPSLYQQYLADDAYTGSSWQRTNNVSKGDFEDDESFCVFASHAAATMDDLTEVFSVNGWFDNHPDVKDLTALGYAAIDSLRAEDMQKLTKLEKVALPVTLITIGPGAFAQSPNLRYVDMLMCDSANIIADVKAHGLASLGIDSLQTLVYLPQTYGEAKGTNIVVFNGAGFTTKTFRLVDGKDYCVPYAFETDKVENTRTLAGKGKAFAAFLPYALTLDTSKAKAYKPTDREGTMLTFTEVSGGEMEALKPYVVRLVEKKATLDSYEPCVIPASTGTLVTSANEWDVPGYVMRGTMNRIDNATAVETGMKMLVNGEWTDVPANNENAYIAPFRAYMLESGNTGGTKILTMQFVDDEATGIDTIRTIDCDGTERYYDLSGRQLSGKPEHGIYIHNGKKYIVK